MARAAQALANDRNVTAVACFTLRGQSAWLISKIRPRVPILAFTPDERTYTRLSLLWGVTAQLIDRADTLETMLEQVDRVLLKATIKPGEQVVLVCGYPVGESGVPNMALLHTVGRDRTSPAPNR
jgi:pyruvate kinase